MPVEKRAHKNAPPPALVTETPAVSYTMPPWSCRDGEGGIEIEAYNEETGDWVVIAKTVPAPGIDPKPNADFLLRAVNNYDRDRQVIAELISALEMCIGCDKLSWEAEQEASIVLARAKLA